MDRITRDQMLCEVALVMEKRSTCGRGKAGAVIARDGRIISTGYNGPVVKASHCSPQMCDISKSCIKSVHAEANAIVFAAKHGISIDGSTLYCTKSPCAHICAPLIVNSGIVKVIYLEPFRDLSGLGMLQDSGVETFLMNRLR